MNHKNDDTAAFAKVMDAALEELAKRERREEEMKKQLEEERKAKAEANKPENRAREVAEYLTSEEGMKVLLMMKRLGTKLTIIDRDDGCHLHTSLYLDASGFITQDNEENGKDVRQTPEEACKYWHKDFNLAELIPTLRKKALALAEEILYDKSGM